MRNSLKRIVSGMLALVVLFAQVSTVNATLLPIKEVSVSLDLSELLPGELRVMKVSDILSKMVDKNNEHPKVEKDAKVVWSRFTGDSGSIETDKWQITDLNSTVDLMPVFYDSYATMELIVGSGNQLDPDNVRYTLDIKGPELKDVFNLDLYLQEEVSMGDSTTRTVRSHVDFTPSYSKRKFTNKDGITDIQSNLRFSIPPGYDEDSYYFTYMTLKSENYPDAEMRVYDGRFATAEAAIAAAMGDPSVDVTDELASPDMTQIDAGLGGRYSDEEERRMLTAVYKRNGEVVGFDYFYLTADPRSNSINHNDIYSINEKGETVCYEGSNTTYYDQYGAKVIKFDMAPETPADNDYYFSLNFYDGNKNELNNSLVVKAVEGSYASIQAAAKEPDIKDKLFVDSSAEGFKASDVYKANFSGEGKNFTVFSGKAGTEVWKIKVLAEDITEDDEEVLSYEEPPVVDSDDKYFSVREIKDDGRNTDTYIIPYDQDTYYSLGYQTLLVNDTQQSLKSVSPEVRLGYHAKVYKDGKAEDTGDDEESENVIAVLSPADFTKNQKDTSINPNGSVRYTVSAENHIDHKNYWITVAKKEKGGKLFVNGPDTREIFINDYYGNVHDIFVANIGSEKLTGIKVSLDSNNIELDDYWTIGGQGNDTLAPFDSTVNTTGNYKGELPNVGKIRLIAKGEGDISGTLTVTADGQEPRVIKITGKAGNPKIDTDSLHDGVLYVPYSTIITTNNMHDWNRVTFSLEDGILPEGLELLPSGEIYGVPLETGKFDIRVKADFSSHEFEPSYADLTLNILDNTDENVNAQVDDGFAILVRIPDIEVEEGESAGSQVFEYEYDYKGHEDEFQGLWLDGVKLVKGIDYTVSAGSTNNNISDRIFNNISDGTHTLAAANRSTVDNRMQKSAQNFTKKTKPKSEVKTAPTQTALAKSEYTTPAQQSSNKNTASTGSPNNTSSASKSSVGRTSKGSRKAVSTPVKEPVYYTVTYVVNGGTKAEPVQIEEGKILHYLITPEKEGYRLEGWYKDEDLTEKFDNKVPINASVTLYAKWERVNCRVWFDTNGGSYTDSREVLGDTEIGTLPTPKKLGYSFVGWFTDPEFTNQFNVDSKVFKNMTLYAKWNEIEVPPVAPENAADFVDISKDMWYYKDVDWAYGSKLIDPYNNALFAPDEPITMGAFVTALAKLSGEDTSKFDTVQYKGIQDGQWYSSYAKWAQERVMKPQAEFDPNAVVTREEASIMIVKYLNYINAGYGAAEGYVNFTDSVNIAPEAMDAIQVLYKNGILSGKGGNNIDPKGIMSKAEFAAVIHRVNYFNTTVN